MITRDQIETAYCFFHQKERVFAHSSMEWQRDDIEYAISSYIEGMNHELYATLSCGREDFLCCHTHFHEDILNAIDRLERMMQAPTTYA